jgi:hypothetical protein
LAAYIDPVSVDLDVFDFAISSETFLTTPSTLRSTPSSDRTRWARSDPAIPADHRLVRDILDIGDDVQEWLQQLLVRASD